MAKQSLREQMAATLKSSETEDWLDYHVVRPFSFLWAKFFAKLGVHPNAVTIMSMFIGAAACLFFVHGSWYYEGWHGVLLNVVGILLLLWADVFDCTDGQLARMTGKKSRLGRILDGLAGFTWYIPIYAALVYRIYRHHDLEFSLFGIAETDTNALIIGGVAFVLALVSGAWGIAGQQRIADYYIQVHLFFLKGEKGAELDNSVRQRELYEQMGKDTPFYLRLFQRNYISYTQMQEHSTPQFQRLMRLLTERYGTIDRVPEALRRKVHDCSLPLMKYNGLLTFNFRTSYLVVFTLLDVPLMVFVFELVVMELIRLWVIRKHERFCRQIADEIEALR